MQIIFQVLEHLKKKDCMTLICKRNTGDARYTKSIYALLSRSIV